MRATCSRGGQRECAAATGTAHRQRGRRVDAIGDVVIAGGSGTAVNERAPVGNRNTARIGHRAGDLQRADNLRNATNRARHRSKHNPAIGHGRPSVSVDTRQDPYSAADLGQRHGAASGAVADDAGNRVRSNTEPADGERGSVACRRHSFDATAQGKGCRGGRIIQIRVHPRTAARGILDDKRGVDDLGGRVTAVDGDAPAAGEEDSIAAGGAERERACADIEGKTAKVDIGDIECRSLVGWVIRERCDVRVGGAAGRAGIGSAHPVACIRPVVISAATPGGITSKSHRCQHP